MLIYRPEWKANRFRKPHIIAIGYLVFGATVAAYLWYAMSKENARRDALTRGNLSEGSRVEGTSLETFEEKEAARLREGDKHVDWRYQV